MTRSTVRPWCPNQSRRISPISPIISPHRAKSQNQSQSVGLKRHRRFRRRFLRKSAWRLRMHRARRLRQPVLRQCLQRRKMKRLPRTLALSRQSLH